MKNFYSKVTRVKLKNRAFPMSQKTLLGSLDFHNTLRICRVLWNFFWLNHCVKIVRIQCVQSYSERFLLIHRKTQKMDSGFHDKDQITDFSQWTLWNFFIENNLQDNSFCGLRNRLQILLNFRSHLSTLPNIYGKSFSGIVQVP